MNELTFLPGVEQFRIVTGRLEMAYLEVGPPHGTPVVLVHGNASCSWFFQDLMLMLGRNNYRVLAPDMRGYGHTQPLPLNATHGVRDFADDLHSFVQALGLENFHLLGWSLGGNICLEYALSHSGTLRSLALEATGSPYGFGGTQGLDGRLNFEDAAGSGAGTVNPEFLKRLKAGDRSADDPASPRNVMNSYYFKPPFKAPPEHEEIYLSALLSTVVGEDNYPGDFTASPNWPNIAPGTRGVINGLSPKYLNQSAFADISPRPDVLWIRGADDQIVSDNSLFDMAMLGQLQVVPGWPGPEVCPPQPMNSQTRAMLERYRANGGQYAEVVYPDCGHSPHIERPDEFGRALLDFFSRR